MLLPQLTECLPYCHTQTPSLHIFWAPLSEARRAFFLDPGVYQAALCSGAFAHVILAAWSIGLLLTGLSGWRREPQADGQRS